MSKVSEIVKKQASKSVKRLNPQFFGLSTHPASKVTPEQSKRVLEAPSAFCRPSGSFLATKFITLWTQLDGQLLTSEHRFHTKRRWRFDFAHIKSKIAIEINGGIWLNGRHNRGQGYINDLEKLNEAQFLGWRVFQLHNATITAPNLKRLIDLIRA